MATRRRKCLHGLWCQCCSPGVAGEPVKSGFGAQPEQQRFPKVKTYTNPDSTANGPAPAKNPALGLTAPGLFHGWGSAATILACPRDEQESIPKSFAGPIESREMGLTILRQLPGTQTMETERGADGHEAPLLRWNTGEGFLNDQALRRARHPPVRRGKRQPRLGRCGALPTDVIDLGASSTKIIPRPPPTTSRALLPPEGPSRRALRKRKKAGKLGASQDTFHINRASQAQDPAFHHRPTICWRRRAAPKNGFPTSRDNPFQMPLNGCSTLHIPAAFEKEKSFPLAPTEGTAVLAMNR